MTETVETGYQVTEREEPRTERKMEWFCEHCGSTDVTSDWTCEWNVEYQAWVGLDHYGNDDYCSNCQDRCEADTREVSG